MVSIHQPAPAIFDRCDRLLLLSKGHVAYSGPTCEVAPYFGTLEVPIPTNVSVADFVIDFVNTDFIRGANEEMLQLDYAQQSWRGSEAKEQTDREMAEVVEEMLNGQKVVTGQQRDTSVMVKLSIMTVLICRSLLKSRRDIVVFGIRFVMYIGLALMMGTVWLRLTPTQENIQAFINAIFFGGAFMSFMAVAYIPAYLEDHRRFCIERADGLYGPATFQIANIVVAIPFLAAIATCFSAVAYWLMNFRPDFGAFMTWTFWLFLDLVAAESLVVLISSMVPIFVVALAATAFANGLWMCTGGFLVPTASLNPFWRYLFHYIDYQSYVFRGMMINEFGHRKFSCAPAEDGANCRCMYDSQFAGQCMIDGNAVLEGYGLSAHTSSALTSSAIVIAIIIGFRLLCGLLLFWRRP